MADGLADLQVFPALDDTQSEDALVRLLLVRRLPFLQLLLDPLVLSFRDADVRIVNHHRVREVALIVGEQRNLRLKAPVHGRDRTVPRRAVVSRSETLIGVFGARPLRKAPAHLKVIDQRVLMALDVIVAVEVVAHGLGCFRRRHVGLLVGIDRLEVDAGIVLGELRALD